MAMPTWSLPSFSFQKIMSPGWMLLLTIWLDSIGNCLAWREKYWIWLGQRRWSMFRSRPRINLG